ncbi:hypothetical protein SAMN05421821_102103 [Mucilaginibacter lappiensis]|uniref:ABC-2 family transporter protein n=1 Tax=Mucilaginibacter lappiensis TaxID=354630 RepID=A0ABR6PFW8_9SPHI|nr:hypothetical protein [Mucilaginibacter lappiensis]MBB6108662.1 hypothetical protein [Mucilaginibacter lappiensis]SIQ28839.1 hypothetical protein SAMN05421821_102103 [Mucilaginibacter lappiensis]
MKIKWSVIFARLAELICFGTAFWFIRFWVVNYEKRLDAFSTAYDRSLQHSDVNFFSVLLIVFIAGYYLMVFSLREYYKRFTMPGIDLIKSNGKIIRLRIAGLVCMLISLIIIGATASKLPDTTTAMIFVVPSFAIGAGLVPYFVFYKLTDIFTLKYCAIVTLTIIAITFIAGYFHFPPTLAFVFSGIPVFAALTKKYGQAERFIRTGKTDLN